MSTHMFPLEQYMVAVASAASTYTDWRYGQILFNVLHDGWPDIANSIRGEPGLDPFYFDKGSPVISNFFKYLSGL